jgi:hypothetical protein
MSIVHIWQQNYMENGCTSTYAVNTVYIASKGTMEVALQNISHTTETAQNDTKRHVPLRTLQISTESKWKRSRWAEMCFPVSEIDLHSEFNKV